MDDARTAYLRAIEKWEEAGRPGPEGPDPQLPLFPLCVRRPPEVEAAQKLDRPRKRRK